MAGTYLEGMLAYHRQDFESAASALETCWKARLVYDQQILTLCYNHLAGLAWARQNGLEALRAAERALAVDPDSLLGLFNAGVAEWYVQKTSRNSSTVTGSSGEKWQQRLHLFILRATQTSADLPASVQTARNILSGSQSGRPLLLVPSPPRPVADTP